MRRTERHFQRSKKFSLEKRLRDSFGVHSGEGQFDVVIRFNARVADYVREKIWHESQTQHSLKGGGVELRMKLSGLAKVERWVLSWGGDATAIAPRELAESVKAAALSRNNAVGNLPNRARSAAFTPLRAAPAPSRTNTKP